MFLMKNNRSQLPSSSFPLPQRNHFQLCLCTSLLYLSGRKHCHRVFYFGHCMVTFPYGKWGLCTLFSSSTPCTINSHPYNIVTAQFWLEKYSGFTLLWLSMLLRHGAYMKLLFSYHHSLFLELIIFFLLVYLFLSVCFSCVCSLCNYHSFNT